VLGFRITSDQGGRTVLASLFLGVALSLPQPATDSSFWRESDGRLAIATALATGAVAVFDERIARWTRQPSVQGGSGRHDVVSAVTLVNEIPLTILAVTVYGVGKLGKSSVVADVGAHLTESLVATIVSTEIVRIGLSRARPRERPDDPFTFVPGRGFTRLNYRAFPSVHAAVAFATAAALSEEIRLRKARRRKLLTPLLFAAATVPGFTRLYLDQHWASDILLGSVVGAFLGTRVVRYAHSHHTKVDRVLLGAHPGVDGPVATVVVSLAR
jgi:membrane-associated phospholipid phosphatase